MKNYLIFSDVHGDGYALSKIKALSTDCSGVFFAGDGLGSLGQFGNEEVYTVAGNCDLFGESERIVEIEGVKILLAHGHRYGVKNGYLNLIMRAKELQVNAVIFGHTHIPEVFTEDGVLFINPGSCSYYAVKRTYAVMFIYKGKPSAVINEII